MSRTRTVNLLVTIESGGTIEKILFIVRAALRAMDINAKVTPCEVQTE